VTGPGVTWIVVGQERKWNELDAAGRALQSRLLADYGRFSSLVDALFRFAPDRVRRDAATAAATVRAVIDQSEGTSHETTAEVLEVALVQITMERYSHLFEGAYADVSDELEKLGAAPRPRPRR
jgi:hypothetical protein